MYLLNIVYFYVTLINKVLLYWYVNSILSPANISLQITSYITTIYIHIHTYKHTHTYEKTVSNNHTVYIYGQSSIVALKENNLRRHYEKRKVFCIESTTKSRTYQTALEESVKAAR